LAAFVTSSVYYSPLLFGKAYMTLSGIKPGTRMPAWVPLLEFVRTLFLSYVVARLFVILGGINLKGALQLGGWLWLGFPAMLLMGSVMWQKFPWRLAVIHGGDWLLKLLLMVVVLAVWR
jgi:Protein of unknown function (DUF1761)